MSKIYGDRSLLPELLAEQSGGFVNGGSWQLNRPNFFITPQGRCAENLLFQAMKHVCPTGKTFVIPSNGFFDTTEANCRINGCLPINLFSPTLTEEFELEDVPTRNPFKGAIDIDRLLEFLERVQQSENKICPFVLLTITNNTAAGQPVSLKHIKDVRAICDRFEVPLMLDACRFAENAWFIKMFEDGCQDMSIPAIVKEMFSHCDLFTISLKKDGMANIGGALSIRDGGLFQTQMRRWNNDQDIGFFIKQSQIVQYGNDSYGGLTGRDLLCCAIGLTAVMQFSYLSERILQTRYLAVELMRRGISVLLPPGGHAIYLDMTAFSKVADTQQNRWIHFLELDFQLKWCVLLVFVATTQNS
eukprot:Lithocolla_globosa_v1_NODE_3054_length_1780_cov_23.123478.p1 type:complete len:359 gc:universal NODE_3054_length_1780_cov_23.123478:636-1712(+)